MQGMTDNEIIKALECCKDRGCQGCIRLYSGRPIEDDCRLDLIYDTLDLIKRQKAEIKLLRRVIVSNQNALARTNLPRDR